MTYGAKGLEVGGGLGNILVEETDVDPACAPTIPTHMSSSAESPSMQSIILVCVGLSTVSFCHFQAIAWLQPMKRTVAQMSLHVVLCNSQASGLFLSCADFRFGLHLSVQRLIAPAGWPPISISKKTLETTSPVALACAPLAPKRLPSMRV